MNMLTRFLGLVIVFALVAGASFGQTIKGTVKDTAGSAVPYASVNLKNSLSNSIIAFAMTNNKGAYLLSVPAGITPSNLIVEVQSIGFKNQAKTLRGFDIPLDFVMMQSVSELQAVTIKSGRPVLRTSGDTLSYRVSDFTSPQDRVIGDVIKKLPGISVASDGTISYNGKTISNLYIGGDNLLDDKYNIATNTIPHGVVEQVQVIENHQPIKMLQNKVMSDDVALNLTIKKEAKLQLVGQESVGVGLPANYDVDLNAMMFTDKYKAINYLQGNNTGKDVQNDLVSHNLSAYLQMINNDKPAAVLSLGTATTPDLPENRYLFDQSGIINLNNLVNLKKGEQLRVNFSYLHDTQKQEYTQATQTFLPGDTVQYSETENNRFRPDMLHGQFTLNINRDKYFLNDALIADFTRQAGYSRLGTDSSEVIQSLLDNKLDFSNEFRVIEPLQSSNIIELYSYINHISEPEKLAIAPNFNPGAFNNDNPYAQLAQTVNIPTWFTNNYYSFKIPSDYYTQSYRAGFVVQSQKLGSDLDVIQSNNIPNPESDSSANRLSWLREKAFAEAAYDLPGKILKANLTLPLSLQQISYGDSLYSLKKTLTRLYFDPQFRVKYQVGVENYISLLYNLSHIAGNIQDVYHGYILKNYRTLYSNNADLTQQKQQTASMGFTYHRALTLFFFSVNVSYQHIDANNISSSIISNSFQQRTVLPYDNKTDAWTTNGYISKYWFALRTTFSGGISWQNNRSNQIQNDLLLLYNTVSSNFSLGTETKASDQLTFSYKANLEQTQSHSLSGAAPAYRIAELIQQAAINYSPTEDWLIKVSGEHYSTYQSQTNPMKYFFADASIKYRFKKFKTEAELSAINLFNVQNYSALTLAANTFTASSYTLPGRIVMLKLFFNI
jgi:hypothetical protein